MDILQRLEMFYTELRALPPFRSHDQALTELNRVMDYIEDTYSGVHRSGGGAPKETRGRMYGPNKDFEVACGIERVRLYKQRKHSTYIGENGAVLIVQREQQRVEFKKAGYDGKEIDYE